MKKTIITTVGTSIFENYMSTDVQDCLKTAYEGIGTDVKKIRDTSNSSNDYDDEKIEFEIEDIEQIITSKFFNGIQKN